jgi:hypothetical protein
MRHGDANSRTRGRVGKNRFFQAPLQSRCSVCELRTVLQPPVFPEADSREGFSCEVGSLDIFQNTSRAGWQKGLAAIYVMSEGGATVLGYYTLSSYTIDAGELLDEAVAQTPRLSQVSSYTHRLLGTRPKIPWPQDRTGIAA